MAPAHNSKQHSACDQCRKRKLRCSGESSGCTRCLREGLECIYSAKKTMGRPRKHHKEDSSPVADSVHTHSTPQEGSVLSEDYSMKNTSGGYAEQESNPPNNGSEFDNIEEYFFPSDGSHSEQQVLPTMPAAWDPSYYDTATLGMSQPWEADIAHEEPLLLSDIPLYEQLPSATDANQPGQQNGIAGAPMPKCNCLSNMYLAGSDMQIASFQGFPFMLKPIRSAIDTAHEILVCPYCPLEDVTARQNIMLTATMLNTIAAEIEKLLHSIDAEASQAEAEKRGKTLRMGDNAHQHLHTGGPDCPVGFEVELAPREWKLLAKRVVRQLVAPSGANGKVSLESLVTQFENRQRAWHRNPPVGMPNMISAPEIHNHEHEFGCLQLAKEVRRQITSLPMAA